MDVGLTTDPWQLNTAQRAVDQVGPADHKFLVRRDGSHFLIEGVKLVHRVRGGDRTEARTRPAQKLVTGSGQIVSLGN